MRNHETGEIELVVGNRQLLSGFFIVVLLCAVAFAMGYVVGQNSPRSVKAGDQSAGVVTATPPESRPTPASPAPPPVSRPSATSPDPAGAAPTGAGSDLSAPPNAAETAAPTTKPAKDAEVPSAPPPPSASPAEAQPGSYWQVSAIANQEAVNAM